MPARARMHPAREDVRNCAIAAKRILNGHAQDRLPGLRSSLYTSWSRGKEALKTVPRLRVLPCTARNLERAWKYFHRADLRHLSAVDALSFLLMTDRRIRVAFAFDGQFAIAGFRMIG